MEKELDPTIIKTTQLALGKYVKRPPLSEKLLKKPPFRFLHDVITTVLNTTGFFRNLFEADELISDNVKERDSKISFLNKVVVVLSTTTGKTLTVKPSKIVAGQEPEKTNELLQCLAQALDEKLSSDAAVKKYKDSLKSTEPETKNKESTNKPVKKQNSIDSKKLSSRSNEKLTTKKNDNRTVKQDKDKVPSESKSKKKDNEPIKTENTKKIQQSKTDKSKKKVQEQAKGDHVFETDDDIAHSRSKEKEQNVLTIDDLQPFTNLDIPPEGNGEQLSERNFEETARTEQQHEDLNASYTIADTDLNSSSSTNLIEKNAVSKDIVHLEASTINETPHNQQFEAEQQNRNNKPDFELSPKLQKSAIVKRDTIKQPDKEKNSNIETAKPDSETNILRPQTVRPSSSRPGAPRMREKSDNVIKDTDNLLLGKVNIIIENTHNEEEEDNLIIVDGQQEGSATTIDQQMLPTLSNEHGHLVQQILDSQKELSLTAKTEIEWQFGMQKARESINQEVEQLRFNVQALSRVTNPLRKLLDHIQEDVEVMRQEHYQWSNINEEVSKDMIKQTSAYEDSLMPFHTKIKQLESDIEEKREKVNDLKVLIQRNAIRIEKLLANGSVQ